MREYLSDPTVVTVILFLMGLPICTYLGLVSRGLSVREALHILKYEVSLIGMKKSCRLTCKSEQCKKLNTCNKLSRDQRLYEIYKTGRRLEERGH